MNDKKPQWKTLATVYNRIIDLRTDVDDLGHQTDDVTWTRELDEVLGEARQIVWAQIQEWENAR